MTSVKFKYCKRGQKINVHLPGLLLPLNRGETRLNSTPGETIRIFIPPKPTNSRGTRPTHRHPGSKILQRRTYLLEDGDCSCPQAFWEIPNISLGASLLTAMVLLLQLNQVLGKV